MNLVIDIGNTQAKVAVFEQTILQFKDQFLQSELLSGLLDLTEQYNIKNIQKHMNKKTNRATKASITKQKTSIQSKHTNKSDNNQILKKEQKYEKKTKKNKKYQNIAKQNTKT